MLDIRTGSGVNCEAVGTGWHSSGPWSALRSAGWISLVLVVSAAAVPTDERGDFRASADKSGGSSSAARGRDEERVNVLVEMDPQQDAARRPAVRAFVAQRGARVAHEFAILPHVLSIRDLSRVDAERLRTFPGVRDVQEDFPVSAFLNESVELIRGTQAQIFSSGHAGAEFSAGGAGVRVCVVDTGINSDSVMYASRIDVAAGYDFFNNDPDPEDDHGHGSHVAGILLGSADTLADIGCGVEEAFAGVAPEATLIGVKALNFNAAGLASHLIAAINHCASPDLPGGPAHIINISAGGGQFSGACDTNLVAQAANHAVAAGLVVVAAAGNSNFVNALAAPACGSQVISVGATYDRDYPHCPLAGQTFFSFCVTPTSGGCLQTCVDHVPSADQRCCFSNRSADLDVVAPGCYILSDDAAAPGGAGLRGFCGTSQACPHVAGLATLIRGFNPYLTPLEIRNVIRAGAIDLGAAGADGLFGYGRIDVLNSLLLAAPECVADEHCDDGLFCNGVESCVEGRCAAGAPPVCDDGVACTIDDCDPVTDSCRFAPDDTACANGVFCDGSEVCSPVEGCVSGAAPCPPTETCDEFAAICRPLPGQLWMSFARPTQVAGLGAVDNEDIVAYDLITGAWSWVFDGSDVGLGSYAIDALARLPEGDLLLSFANRTVRIPGLIGGPGGGDRIDNTDIVRFHPTSLGPDTAGTFHFHFDGSDVGLTSNNHNVDALSRTPEGNLLLSLEGSFAWGKFAWGPSDVFLFVPTELGAFTSGSFAPYFYGLAASLGDDPGENVGGAARMPDGRMLLVMRGPFATATASGTGVDVLELSPVASRPGTADLHFMLRLTDPGLDASSEVSALEYVP